MNSICISMVNELLAKEPNLVLDNLRREAQINDRHS